MTCDDIEVQDVFGLSFSKVDFEFLLKKEEIPYYKEQDGTFYFKSEYARQRAKILYLNTLINEVEETLPAGYFKEE